MNNITIEIYSTGTSRIRYPDELFKAQNLRFATGYPGGLYLDGSFYIARDVLDFLPIKANYRVVFRNGQNIVYEGWVDGEVSVLNETDQGIEIPLIGAWGRWLMRRTIAKIWADNRVSEDVWKYEPTPAGEAYCDVSRLTDAGPALLFQPQNIEWTTEHAQVKYTMPAGLTVAQVAGSYDLTTGTAATDWILSLNNGASGALLYTIKDSAGTADTYTGTFDHTLGTPINSVTIRLTSQTTQTPIGDGSTYAEITDLLIFDGTADVNLSNIVSSIIPSDFNSDTSHIDTITDDGYGRSTNDGIIPFIIDRWTSYADIFTQAASFGDNSFNSWAVGCYHSEMAASPDGKPVIFAEQQPVLTDYDYAIRIDEENLVAPLGIERDYSNIWNNIRVEYYDENGTYQRISSTDGTHSALADSTSQSTYGRRDYVLNVGSSTAEAAYDSGQRFLAKWKDPQYKLNGPITVLEYIRKRDGRKLPACEIMAGKLVRIQNYQQDLSGSGLTFLISHTEYDDESETCSIQAGIPDDLIFPTFVFDPVGRAPGPSPDAAASASSGDGGGADRLNWKRQYGLTPGTPEWDEAVRLGKANWLRKYPNKKRKRRR